MLTVPRTTARRLGLKPVSGQAIVAVATGACRPAGGVTLTLRPSRGTLSRIGRLLRPVPATVTIALAAPGATPGAASTTMKLA